MAHRPENFLHFYEGWLLRQKLLLHQLLDLSNSNSGEQKQHVHKAPVDQVLSHYRQYFEAKSNAAEQDICLIFCPPWLTSLENVFLWISDLRPSLTFRLLCISVSGLSLEQSERLEAVKAETAREERVFRDEFENVQERAAAPPLVVFARRVGRVVDGEVFDLVEAVEEYKEALLAVVERADELRRSTVMKIAEILSPSQTVKFLAAVAKFQLDLRKLGLEMEAQGA